MFSPKTNLAIILSLFAFIILSSFYTIKYFKIENENFLAATASVFIPTPITSAKKYVVIAVNGAKSKGEFSAAVTTEVTNSYADGVIPSYLQLIVLPQSNSAVKNGENVKSQINSILAYDPTVKILVAAHSIGAIGTYNYKYTGTSSSNVSYLLYDPPYAADKNAPFFISGNPKEIKKAVTNGMATLCAATEINECINWSDGYDTYFWERSQEQKDHNALVLAQHTLFMTYPNALIKIGTWIEAIPQPCTSFTYSAWTPSSCIYGQTQTRTLASSSPSGCIIPNPPQAGDSVPSYSQSCPSQTQTCIYHYFSDWSTCSSEGIQTQTLLPSSIPYGCTAAIGTTLTKSCTPPPTTQVCPAGAQWCSANSQCYYSHANCGYACGYSWNGGSCTLGPCGGSTYHGLNVNGQAICY